MPGTPWIKAIETLAAARGWLAVAILSVLACRSTAAVADADRVAALYRPFQAGRVALAPDGKHLAYALQRGDEVAVAIVDVDRPGTATIVKVEPETWPVAAWGDPPALEDMILLRWASADRLIYETNYFRIYGVDSNGANVRELANPGADSTSLAKDDSDLGNQKFVTSMEGMANNLGAVRDNATVYPTPPPRRVRVVAFPSGDSRHIIVEAPAPLKTSLFKVDVITGASETCYEEWTGQVLTDQEGAPRIFYRQTTGQPVTHLFYYTGGRSLLGLKSEDLDTRFAAPAFAPFTVSPETYFETRSIPLGFDYDPDVLYFASNAKRDTYGIYALNVRTGRRTDFAVEDPQFDLARPDDRSPARNLVFDRYKRRLAGVRLSGVEPGTRWLDPELAHLQSRLESRFPKRSVEIVDWDEARTRFLVLVSADAVPGRYYLYCPSIDRLDLFLRWAPWLAVDDLNSTEPFGFTSPAGVKLSGYVTTPRHPKISPPPLLVYCHDGPWMRDQPGFDREVQALAGMGFVVLQVNYRGSLGFGAAFRQAGQKDISTRPVEDILAAIDWVIAQKRVNPRRVAIFGQGFGGYLALRALQTRPDGFRSAITIDAPADLGAWVRYDNNPDIKSIQDDAQTAATSRSIQRHMAGQSGVGLRDLQRENQAEMDAARAMVDTKALDFDFQVRRQYFGADFARFDATSPALHPDAIKQPVFVIDESDSPDMPGWQATKMLAALGSRSVPRARLQVGRNLFTRGLPEARIQVLLQIEEFLNLTVYESTVDIGDLKILR